MPDLRAHYDAMRAAALPQLARGGAELDALLDAGPADTRRGLTLLARPPALVAAALAPVLAELRSLEPTQYYYPTADLHLTVLSLLSCAPGFTLAAIEPGAYCRLVAEALRDMPPLRLVFDGLTASPGGILLQGFPQDEGLAELRARLRTVFQHSGLVQSIDHRYRLQTAHLTLVRFRRPLHSPAQLATMLSQYRQYYFGEAELDALELVFNDWYQRASHTVLLEKYRLGK